MAVLYKVVVSLELSFRGADELILILFGFLLDRTVKDLLGCSPIFYFGKS